MDTINLRFQYTKEEYTKAWRIFYLGVNNIRKHQLIIFGIGGMVVGMGLYITQNLLLVLISALVLGVAGCRVFDYFKTPLDQFKYSGNYFGEFDITISIDGIIVKTAENTSESTWDAYNEIWESNNYFFLLRALHVYTILPKRAFADEGEAEAFKAIAAEHLPGVRQI